MEQRYKIFRLLLVLLNCVQIDLKAEDLMQRDYANMSQQELDENLISAVENNRPIDVHELILAGANIAQSIRHSTPCGEYDTIITLLDYAKDHGYKDVEQELINARTNKNVSSAIVAASQVGDLATVKEIMKDGINSNYLEYYSMALLIASQQGYSEIVHELIKGGVDVHYKNGVYSRLALFDALSYGHLGVMRELIKAGVDIDSLDDFGNTCLIKAISCQNIEIVKFLLSAKCNVNYETKCGKTALNEAVFNRQPILIHELIQAGADIDQKMGDFRYGCYARTTVLEYAVNLGDNEILNSLKKSKKALIVASKEGHLNFVQKLVREGFDLNISDDDGNTALILASRYGKLEVVEELLRGGAHINFANKNGDTALIKAVENGNKKVVEMYLKYPKININHINKNGQTALKIALEKAPSPYLDYWDPEESLDREMIANLLKEFLK